MMKSVTFAIIVFNVVQMDRIYAAYPLQKCYVCDTKRCEQPTAANIKTCSDNTTDGRSGHNFVQNVFGNTSDVHALMALNLSLFGTSKLDVNSSIMPTWESLTRWVNHDAFTVNIPMLLRSAMFRKINIAAV
jgi:hypothetical protein